MSMKPKKLSSVRSSITNIRVPRSGLSLQVYYQGGANDDLDRELRKIVGKPTDGSGQFLNPPFTRELSWCFRDEKAAKLAFRAVATRFRRRVTLPVRQARHRGSRIVTPVVSQRRLHSTLDRMELRRTGDLVLAKADFTRRTGQRTSVRMKSYSW